MDLKKALCILGQHNYRLRRKIFNIKQECVKSIYVCKNCGKKKEYDYDREAEKYNLKGIKTKKEIDNNQENS